MVRLPIRCLTAFMTLLVQAQIPIGQVPSGFHGTQWWDGPTLVSAPDTLREIHIVSPGQKPRDFQTPDRSFVTAVKDGTIFAFRRDGAKGRILLDRGDSAKDWETFAELQDGNVRLLGYYPLKDGRVFLVRGLAPFVQGDQASFFAIGVIGADKKIQISELVVLDQDLFTHTTPSVPGDASTFGPRPGMEDRYFEMSTTLPLPYKDGVAILLPSTGQILLFDSEHGHISKTATLFPSVLDKTNQKRLKAAVFVGYRATEDGDFIIASRSEDAVLSSRSIFEAPQQKDDEDTDAYSSRLNAYNDKALEAFPDLLWWRFDPKTGQFVRLDVPRGMPSALRNGSIYSKFNFWVNYNNQVSASVP